MQLSVCSHPLTLFIVSSYLEMAVMPQHFEKYWPIFSG